VDDLLKFKPFLYSVNFVNTETEDAEVDIDNVEMDSKEKIAEQYIDGQQFASNINVATLKAMFRKMMKEAGESKTRIKAANGTKIECLDVGFKNFLSFGSQWQRIPLHNGVNFVTGLDKDKGKSNGAGKSSFLETIPFALFGKTARDIRQTQIVNWKNKKNCQVVFRFKINEDVYEINRQLKPNRLEIFKNGTLLDQDAHKTDYQNMFEDIFGMDVKMFMSLIHSNVNSSANILNMKKNEKRIFLERMFGLVIYSDMNKLCNEKLRDVEQKKYKIDTEISSADDTIESCRRMKIKFDLEINSKKSTLENVDEIKEKLDELKEDYPDIDEKLKAVHDEIYDKEALFGKVQLEHTKFLERNKARSSQLTKDIEAIDALENQRKENQKVQAKIDAIVEKAGDVDKILADIEEAESGLEQQNSLLDDANQAGLKVYKEIAELKGKLEAANESFQLLANGKCPTCGQDTKDPVKHQKKDITSLKRKITNREKNYKRYTDDGTKHQEEAAVFSNKIKVLHRTKDTLNKLKGQIKDVDTGQDKQELIKEKSLVAQNRMDATDTFLSKQKIHMVEVKALKNKEKQLSIDQGKIKEVEKKYDMAVSRAEEVKKHVISLKEMIKEQEARIESVTNSIQDSNEKKKKLVTLADYINAIKIILKDENIKQFTIKQIMPFINKQTNSYLSEVNYGFYVKVDKWLDVEIKGPGIRNASYGSLSGGERRGIDIAIQLSLLDVARTQAGIFPDLLVFDELLDSSIDSRGINELMKIVKAKQTEFGGKIFVITHRPEVDGELIDYEYKVVKENGYSKVYI
jgi:DNA repair exonuclease SbcCD ATPase subunit